MVCQPQLPTDLAIGRHDAVVHGVLARARLLSSPSSLALLQSEL